MYLSAWKERKRPCVEGGWKGKGHGGGGKNEKAKSLLLSFNDGACCDFVSPAGTREKLGAETFSVSNAAER